jgi:hypothetical protein
MSREPADKQQALEQAHAQAEKVQHELEIAGAELGLTHGALDRHIPAEVRQGDVAWAIEQNAAIERKVQQAADELEEVTELLEQVRKEAA